MKKSFRILTLLMVLLLLTGCNPLPEETVPAVTEVPTEATTEATTEPPAPRELSAEDVFYRCKFATGTRANAFSASTQANLRIGSAGVYVRTELAADQHIILSEDPVQVNVLSHTKTNLMNMEVEQTTQEYYRQEGEKLMCYFGVKEAGIYGKEDIFLEGMTPYLIIAQHAVYGCPGSLPDDLQMQPERITADDREVYVLEYTQSAIELFFFQSPGMDADALTALRIPVVHYVDAETFETAELQYTVPDMDSELIQSLVPGGADMFSEGGQPMDIEIQSYTCRLYNLGFEPTEVPPIPEEVLEGILDADGYTST